MITQDFRRFFGENDVAEKVAEFAEANGIALKISRYLEAYEERDPDRGHFYSILGCFADHHSFSLSTWAFRENSDGFKEFQPLPTFIEELSKKIDDIASGKDNIVKYVNNDPQQVSAILHKMKGFMTALENLQADIHMEKGKSVNLKDFPYCPEVNAGYTIIKHNEFEDTDGTKLGTVIGRNAKLGYVTWEYSYFPDSMHFNGYNNGHYFSGQRGLQEAELDYYRRIVSRMEARNNALNKQQDHLQSSAEHLQETIDTADSLTEARQPEEKIEDFEPEM